MKAKVKNQFYRCDEFKTSQNITLPLSALLGIVEQTLKYVEHYDCKNLDNVFIKIGQPCFENCSVEVEIWEED